MARLEEQVRTTLTDAVSTAFGVPVDEVCDETRFVADLGAKSVNFVRIISALEDEFDAEIPFMEFRRRQTVGEAVEYVVERLTS